MRILGWIIVIGILAFGIWWFASLPAEVEAPEDNSASEEVNNTARVEENAIVAQDQKGGEEIVVSKVYLAEPGFVVVHKDDEGKPGAIIGVSEALEVGETSNIKINLDEEVSDGSVVYTMLHKDVDLNGEFNEEIDLPVPSSAGGPIMGTVNISLEAEIPGEVTL